MNTWFLKLQIIISKNMIFILILTILTFLQCDVKTLYRENYIFYKFMILTNIDKVTIYGINVSFDESFRFSKKAWNYFENK